ncbi:MAG: tRNA (adenosine(37)-N6)-threonylcarbamoyltransferase complex ATPase subunit type 1 TsaE [bacterium]
MVKKIRTSCISHSTCETIRYGKNISSYLNPGDCVLLYGNLGSGKTVIARGIAQGLGITRRITSPTFTIINEYTGKVPFFHIDLYRLTSSDTVHVGLEEYMWGKGISVVEWAERLAEPDLDAFWKVYIRQNRTGSRTIQLNLPKCRQDAG